MCVSHVIKKKALRILYHLLFSRERRRRHGFIASESDDNDRIERDRGRFDVGDDDSGVLDRVFDAIDRFCSSEVPTRCAGV